MKTVLGIPAAAALLLSALVAQAATNGVDLSRNGRSARVNYMTECQGCHLPDGRGMVGKVPSMKTEVGRFLDVKGGREFLVQVPGSANSKLSDADLADVLNWIITSIGNRPPETFQAFTPQEVSTYRSTRLIGVAEKRQKLVDQMPYPG